METKEESLERLIDWKGVCSIYDCKFCFYHFTLMNECVMHNNRYEFAKKELIKDKLRLILNGKS